MKKNPIAKDFEAESRVPTSGIDYTIQINQLIQQMEQMQNQFNNILDSTSSINPVTPQVHDPASQLMLKTAEITNDLSVVEKNAPILSSNSQEAFHIWRPKFLEYNVKKGKRTMQDLSTQDVNLYYGFIWNLDVNSISSRSCFDKVDEFHKYQQDDISILESHLTMENLKEYNRAKLEDYARQLIFLLNSEI